jgi:uncharacterized protein (UPF0264 family)
VTPLSNEDPEAAAERLQFPNVRLLVSVRNLTEAIAAIQGGADVIDLKEPHNGALGRAGSDVIRAIADFLRVSERTSGFSVALGELTELAAADKSVLNEISTALSPGTNSFLKIGLAGTASLNAADWQNQWRSTRDEIGTSYRWVAVAYADHVRAGSPSPQDICEFAVRSGCDAFLIDTFVKDCHTLTSWLNVEQLSDLIQSAQTAGLKVLSQLFPLRPDLIAVRGAVCEGNVRLGRISGARVAAFREAMRNCSALSRPSTQCRTG